MPELNLEGAKPPSAWKGAVAIIVMIVGVVLLIGLVIGGCKSLTRTGPGEVAVIRNGGPLDSKDIRTTLPPETGFAFQGLFSSKRTYIADDQQRFYTISSDPDRADNPSATSIVVPTRDGVQVSIEGTTNFHTTFTGDGATAEECEAAGLPEDCKDPNLWLFDERFGNRTFTESGSDDSLHVWEDGDTGWSAFLDAQFRPVLVSTFREEIGSLDCAELVSSCALIQQGAESAGNNLAGLKVPENDSEASFQEVAAAVQSKLDTRLQAALGGTFFADFQVQIEKVVLPEEVQDKINTAQAAFAGIAEQRANAEAAKFEALRAKRLAQQYEKSPVLGQIEIAKVLEGSNATIILDGSSGVGLNVGR